jgi:hypothetical protein
MRIDFRALFLERILYKCKITCLFIVLREYCLRQTDLAEREADV